MMNLPRRVSFFGLRREFNMAVSALRTLFLGYTKLLSTVLELQIRVETLEKRAIMEDMLEGLAVRYDTYVIEEEVDEEDEPNATDTDLQN